MMKNIAVFAVLMYNNQIILCKRNYGNFNWTLPGGSVELGEFIIDALKREILEETGQYFKNYRYVLTSYSKEKYSVAFVYFIKLNLIKKFAFDNSELKDVQLFDISNLPNDLSLRQRKWIKICLDDFVYNDVLNI